MEHGVEVVVENGLLVSLRGEFLLIGLELFVLIYLFICFHLFTTKWTNTFVYNTQRLTVNSKKR